MTTAQFLSGDHPSADPDYFRWLHEWLGGRDHMAPPERMLPRLAERRRETTRRGPSSLPRWVARVLGD